MSEIDLEFGNNPTLEGLIKFAVNSMLTHVHTAIPGNIVSYDKSKGLATVQIGIKQKHEGEWHDIPPLVGVPVIMPRSASGAAYISLPLSAGDPGLILFSERSIDAWIQTGGIVNPNDTRKHDFSDAIFYPGLYPVTNPVETDGDNLVINNKKMRITLTPEGKFSAGNGGIITPVLTPPSPPAVVGDNVELLKILSDLLAVLAQPDFVISPGVVNPTYSPLIYALQGAVEGMRN